MKFSCKKPLVSFLSALVAATSFGVLVPATVSGAGTISSTIAGTNTTTGSTTTADQSDTLKYVGTINPGSTDGTGLSAVSTTMSINTPTTFNTGSFQYPPGFAITSSGANSWSTTASGITNGGKGGSELLNPPIGSVSSGTNGDGYKPYPFPNLDLVCYVYHHAGVDTVTYVPNETSCIKMSTGASVGSWDIAPGSTAQNSEFAVIGNRMYITSQSVDFSGSTVLYLSCFDASTLSSCGSTSVNTINVAGALLDGISGGVEMRAAVSNAVAAADGSIWFGDTQGIMYRCDSALACTIYDPYAGDPNVVAFRAGNQSAVYNSMLVAPANISVINNNGKIWLEWAGTFFGALGTHMTCIDTGGNACGLNINIASDGDWNGPSGGLWPRSLGMFPGTGGGACFFSAFDSAGTFGISTTPGMPTGVTCTPGSFAPSGLAGYANTLFDPSASLQYVSHGNPYYENGKMWWITANIDANDQVGCYDFVSDIPCSGFSGPSGMGSLKSYAVGGNPQWDCMYSLGDSQYLTAFGKNTGKPYCGTTPVITTVTPVNSYCSSGNDGWTGWDALYLQAGSSTDRYVVKLRDSTGTVVYTSPPTIGDFWYDISSLGKTSTLTASITYESGATWNSGAGPRVFLTWKGNSPEFCATATTDANCATPSTITNTWAVVQSDFSGSSNSTSTKDFAMGNDLVLCAPVIEVTKTDTISKIELGVPFDYTITVANTGFIEDTNVVLTDQVPTGLVIQSVPSGCTFIGQIVQCNIGTLKSLADGGSTLTFVINVNPAGPFDAASQASVSVQNVAQVRSTTACPPPVYIWEIMRCTALVVDPLTPDISIVTYVNNNDSNTAPGVGIDVGDDYIYTYVVTNTGPVPLQNVLVTDLTLPSTAIDCGAGDNTIATMLPGEIVTCTATTMIATPGQVPTLGTVDGSSSDGQTVTDEDPANWFGVDSRILITKFANTQDANVLPDAPKVDLNSDVEYTFWVRNDGNVTLKDIKVTDDRYDASLIDCGTGDNTIASLAPGRGQICTLDVKGTWENPHVNVGTVIGTEVLPVGLLDFTAGTVTANDLAQTVPNIADVVVEKKALTTVPVNAGDTVKFEITVRNDGPDPALNVNFVDTFGSGLASVDAFTDNAGLVTCAVSGNTVKCPLETMQVGDKVVFTATATVGGIEAIKRLNAIWNYAKAGSCLGADNDTSCVQTFDPKPENNTDDAGISPMNPGAPTDPVCVENSKAPGCYLGRDDVPLAKADVVVIKDVTTPVYDAGAGPADIGFRITVRNDGPDPAKAVKLTEIPESPMTLTAITPDSANPAVTCNIATDMKTASCDLGDMAKDAVIVLDVKATVPKGTLGTKNNIAEAVSQKTVDPNLKNNKDDANPVPTSFACKQDVKAEGCYTGRAQARSAETDIAVEKTVVNKTVAEGGTVNWMIAVTNNGPDTAMNVNLSDIAGGNGHTLENIAPVVTDSATCATPFQCVLNNPLKVGDRIMFTATTTMGTGTAVNTAYVTTTTHEKLLTNNVSKAFAQNPPLPVKFNVPLSRTGIEGTLQMFAGALSSVLFGLGVVLYVRRKRYGSFTI